MQRWVQQLVYNKIPTSSQNLEMGLIAIFYFLFKFEKGAI
jgi:hypothetical protein